MNNFIARLNWYWRLAMTGFCFSLFGIGGLLLSLIWFNVLFVLIRDSNKRCSIARRSISASFRFFLTVTKILGVLDYRIDDVETLRNERGCLVIANHPTLIDYVLLASVMPETDCLVKSALLKNPFVSGVIRAANYLVNSQADSLLPESLKRLQRGDTILIFPEGTRTHPSEKMTLQRGAANISVRCRSDLRVVVIHCSENMLGKQTKWYDVPPNKPIFQINVRDRVRIEQFYNANSQEPALAARQLNRHLLQQLQSVDVSFSGMNDASALP